MRTLGHSVLISSAGRRVQLVRIFQNALQHWPDAKVVATDASPLAPALYEADVHAVVPRCDSGDFLDELLRVCERERVGLIVPTIDTELLVLAAAIDRFRDAGIRIVVSGPETVHIAGDKAATHNFFVQNSIPTVKQCQATDAEQVMESIGLPCIAKPRFGSSSTGVQVIRTPTQLVAALGNSMIAQSIAAGCEYTVDVLCSANGHVLSAVPRQRIETRGGEVSKGRTDRNPAVISLATRVVESLPDASGPLCVQMFQDNTESPPVAIEINARFGGGFPLAASAGADFARFLACETFDHPLPPLEWIENHFMLRYDDAVFVNASSVMS